MRHLGDYSEAKEGYLKALEINKKHYGENHPEYGSTLSNLASVMRYLGDYLGAKESYLKALEIKK